MHRPRFLLFSSAAVLVLIIFICAIGTNSVFASPSYRNNPTITIYGFQGCKFFKKAKDMALKIAKNNGVTIYECPKGEWKGVIKMLQEEKHIGSHSSSPVVFINGKFIGGANEFEDVLRSGNYH